MLGLGASCNNDEGYAKGERYRERFHTGGTYNSGTNPIGRLGKEADYIGDFASSSDIDNFTGGISNGSGAPAIESGTLKVLPTISNGGAIIYVSAIIGVQYKLTFVYDPNGSRNSQGRVRIGTHLSSLDDLADTGDIENEEEGRTQTLTFTPTVANPIIKFSGKSGGLGKKVFFDDISLKEA
tara:strand:- start:165 stop:710 length:546 start_codon:yes stop_codon:yes gene_type:complete